MQKPFNVNLPNLEDLKIRVTNPDRVLYADQGLTKREIIGYYARVAERMLPLVEKRPLTLVRCPRGQEEDCFFQKIANESVPDAVKRVEIKEKQGRKPYVYVDSLESLLSLVQIGVLEIHTWGARIDKLERPDLMVLDVDPGPSVEWPRIAETASVLRERLDMLGLQSFLKSTGGKGLHVVVPLVRRSSWDEVKDFAHALADELVRASPENYTATSSKSSRKGKIYIDYLRNTRGATAISPFSTRSRPGAPIAVPIAWDDLSKGERPEYRAQPGSEPFKLPPKDAWAGYSDLRQSITKKMMTEVG